MRRTLRQISLVAAFPEPVPERGIGEGLPGVVQQEAHRAAAIRGHRDDRTLVTGACAKRGDVFRMITGTGGGYGDPKSRPIEAVRRDLRDGYITKAQATRDCPQ